MSKIPRTAGPTEPPPPDRPAQAFDLYTALGPRRTYRAVADQMGVSLSSVKAWAQKGRWRARLREREADAARQLADRSLKAGVTETERNLKIVRAALLTLAKGIHEGRIKGQMADVDRLIRLEEHLRGTDGKGGRLTAKHLENTPPVEVGRLFSEWMTALSDRDLTEVITALQRWEAGNRRTWPPVPPD